MDYTEARSTLKPLLADYLESKGYEAPRKGKTGVCPACGGGEHTGCFSLQDSTRAKCFSCDAGGDIFDWIGHIEGVKEPLEQLKRAADLFGVPLDGKPDRHEQAKRDFAAPIREQQAPAKPATTTPDMTKFYKKTDLARGYLKGRGISDAVIDAHNVGYDPQHHAVIIPVADGFYIARDLDKHTFYNPPGVPVAIDASPLDQREEPVFIVEGQIDAMSIESAGGRAIALHNANNGQHLLKAARARKKESLPLIILALDNDDPGRAGQEKLKAMLFDEGIRAIEADPYGEGIKDANDLLIKDRNALSGLIFKGIKKAEEIAQESQEAAEKARQEEFAAYWQENSTAAYMARFHELVAETARRPAISTGFPHLDRRLDGGLYDGLYIIGAISSLGKTTFMLQAADHMAATGHDVLFFSLEMSRYELAGKSISRQTFIMDNTPDRRLSKTTRQILNGAKYAYYKPEETALIDQAVEAYAAIAGNIFILESNGNIGPKEIRDAVERHLKLTGRVPVVMIDYLQILKPADPRASDKQNTDWAVSELKRISREHKIPVLAISSLNRENYHMPINLTSFKESGAIEYSSDVLIGLQVEGADTYSDTTKGKNHQDTERKKQQTPREIELKILKNRNGSLGVKLNYMFYPQFNYFIEREPAPGGRD